ncbi:putative N-acetylated-alpha-linked acidic dipeptidase isoform X1 [Montipora foliosa]|uniref:putative N-acetylated-alpha-linked acidic dipeptidase isoform X1 n=1 Tax=Montipora foliosa TaxID=591990 RepID=UPI0035F1829B
MAVPMTRMSELSTSDDAEVEVSTSVHHPSGRKSFKTCIKSPRQRIVFLCVLIAILAAAVGALIGYFVPLALKPSCTKMSSASEDVHKKFADEVSTKELENNLRYFSSKPHVGGSEREKVLADHIAEKWREYGFDDVEMPEYRVLLSLPQEDQPNKVEIVNKGLVEYTILGKINVDNTKDGSDSFKYFPFLSYAPSGEAEGELVYCNEGSESDFQELDKVGISVKGRVVLLRGYNGNVITAERRGAVGALLYVDPSVVAQEGYASKDTYPETVWMSKDAVFSRALNVHYGDQLTPNLPSIPGMYRRPRNESSLPSIPAQPISYGDALHLFSLLKGEEVPSTWRGDLKVTYRFGPGFSKPNTTLRLRVNNKLVVKSIYNVIGTIKGHAEPDRYVLLGNHRDAEFFGAVDASSGTATLMEISRILGKRKSDGWRPRRTVKFCSWGAEEFGLIGSVEWVQENAKLLSNRAVVYLNTDVAVGGNYVVIAQTCPMIENAVFCRAKKVKDPSKSSVYDTMKSRFPSRRNKGEPETIPYMYFSDYLPFYMSIGIPSVDFSYFHGHDDQYRLYPVYHTQEDSFYWMETFIDPKFEYHATMAKLVGGLLLDFSEALVLPYDVVRYAKAVSASFEFLEKELLNANNNIQTQHVKSAIREFTNASNLFQATKEELNGNGSELILRAINDQLVQVEKAFITPYLNVSDPMYKHVFSRNYYGLWFPGVTRAMQNAVKTNEFSEVKIQLSLVEEALLSAADILKPLICK